jgi:uncharacterized Zn finger protein (UPF0148 family)
LSEEELVVKGGLSKADAKKVAHSLTRAETPGTKKCPSCGTPLPEGSDVCTNCGAPPAAVSVAIPKEKLVPYLLRIPRMNQVKADMLVDSGFDNLEKIKAASKEDLRKVKAMGGKTVDEIFAYAQRGGFMTDITCKTCGAQVPPDKLNCPSCDTKIEAEPTTEEEEPDAAKAATVVPKAEIELERSFTYLIKEEKSERSYHLFEKTLAKGMRGFCVTRNYPLKIKNKFNLGETPILWLSNVGKENSIRPKDLEKLSVSLEQFLSSEEGGIILLDGLEYLITNNNFLTMLRLVQSLRDQVAINHSILLLAMNPSTLDAHELNLLEKEVDATL